MQKFSSSDPVFDALRTNQAVNRQALDSFVTQVNTNPVLNSYVSKVGTDLVIRLKTGDEVLQSRDGAFFKSIPDNDKGQFAIALNPDWFIGPNAKFPTTATLTVSHELDHYTRVAQLQKSTEILNDESRTPIDRLGGYIELRMQVEVMGARAEFQALRAAYGIAADAPIPQRYQILLSASDRQLLQVEAAGYAQGLRGGALDDYFAEQGAGVLSRNTSYWERYTNGLVEKIGVSPDAVAKLRSDLAYKLGGPDDPIDWSVQPLPNGEEQISRTYANGQTVIENYDDLGRTGRVVVKGETVIERSSTYFDDDGYRVTTTVDNSGRRLSTSSEQQFDDGSIRTRIEYPDGRVVMAVTDAEGNSTSEVLKEASTGAAGEAILGNVQSMLSLIQAIESGDTKAIAASSAAMLANLARLGLTNQELPSGVQGGLNEFSAGLNALAAGLNLFNAVQDGDGLGIVAAGANLGSQAAGLYASMLKAEGLAAFQAESATAASTLDAAAGMSQVAGGLATVASAAMLVLAIENGDPYQIASSAMATVASALAMAGCACPPLAIAAAIVAVAGAIFGDDDVPTLEGEATAVWNLDGTIHVLTTVDKEQGGGTPTHLLEKLVNTLQQLLASQVDANGQPLYAIIPQRLPTIGYAYDPDGTLGNMAKDAGGAEGHLYLKWIDANGQEQTRYFDGNGSRNQEGSLTLAEEFIQRAMGAVVPAWEAQTVLSAMNEHGALTPATTGSIDENRARVAEQLHSKDWQAPDATAGLPEADADGIRQRFTALTVDLKPELPAGADSGRIGRNVDLDAYIEQTDWVQANQGILSIDLNGDGIIGQNEILTNDADAAAAHARNSLQWLDINHDGKLDAADPAFKALGIWLDVNRNGQTDQGEFATFLDRGIASLDFTSTPPVLRAADGSVFNVTEQHLTADVRGDYYQAAFVDADGDGRADTFAGVLHAHEGGETVLNAVVTHDYTGEAGHTHGGELADNASGEMRVDRAEVVSDRQHEQVLAESVVGVGDARVSSGDAQPVAGTTTQTKVDQGDGRLASTGQANGAQPQSVETIRQNDPRITSAVPATAADAYAAIRDEWIRSAQGPFAGAGALVGVGIGTVAVPADAALLGDGQFSAGNVDTIGNNTVSRLPADDQTPAGGNAETSTPAFVPVPVESLPASTHTQPGAVDEVLTVSLTPSEVTSVPHVDEPIPAGVGTSAPLDNAAQPLHSGEEVRLAVPDVVDEQVAGVEDIRYVIDAAIILANDTTQNTVTEPLRLTEVFGAEHGTVSMTVDADGIQRITFTPDPDYWGPAVFRYVVTDQYGLQSMGRVRLDVAPVNDAPVTANENVASDEDAGILLTSAQLLGNDYDVDSPTVGDVLRIVGVSDAKHGLVTLDVDGNVRFLPNHDYFGPAAFTYWVADGNGGLTPATVTLDIRPVNDVPVVTGEDISTDEDTVLLIQQPALLNNDWDVDNPHGDLSVFSVRPGQHGSVELLPDGQIRFVPEQDFYGTATFFYTVTDGAGGYTEAVATVDLAPVNDAPIVASEHFSGSEDEAVTFTAPSLLSNDRDVDDAQPSLKLVAVGSALHGEVRLNPDGSVQFIPEADYFGAASFEYTVSDPHGARTTGRMDIDLAPVNDAPRLANDVIAGTEDTALTFDQAALLANDHDVDNSHEALTITRVAEASHGSVSLNPDGSIRFVPDQDYFGDASFTYEVSDGVGGVSTATAIVHVAAVNDAPIANDDIVDGRKGVAITMTAAALLADDFDIDNLHGDLRIVGVADADHGTVRLNVDGSVTFLPEPGYGGYPGAHGQFTYTIADGAGGFATATTTVSLEKINTTPVAVDDGFSGYENVPFIINTAQFLANDADPDGDALSISQVANAQHGTVAIQPDGQVRFTPDSDFYGQASFQYLATDPYGGQTWATAFLDVTRVNKAPVIEAIEYGRAIFGYYEGPAPQIGIAGPGAGAGPNGAGSPIWASADEYDNRDMHYFQPLYDEALAKTLAAQGQLYSASHAAYTPDHYLNGMLKPLALDALDATDSQRGPTIESDTTIWSVDDPQRQMGRVIAYDPDGDSAAIVMSIVQGPQHGHAYANVQVDTTTSHWLDQTTLAQNLIVSPDYWQYFSHRGDPYNGTDPFTIRITDSEGASTDVLVNPTHKGTNASGGFTPIVLDLNGNGTELLAADHSHIRADVNHDGHTAQIGWAADTDGVLGFDADGDGSISIEETRLTNFVPGAKTDLEALGAFDSNHDGKISSEDVAWSQLKVVQDVDGNGTFTATEHRTLDEADIASIDLERHGQAHLDHGNMVFGTVEVTHTDGSKSDAADVMFAGTDVPLPSFALYAAETGTVPLPEAAYDDHAFAADAVSQVVAAAHAPVELGPMQSPEETQRIVNLFVQVMNTQTAPTDPIGFVPPHEETLADIAARAAQASTVDLGLGQH